MFSITSTESKSSKSLNRSNGCKWTFLNLPYLNICKKMIKNYIVLSHVVNKVKNIAWKDRKSASIRKNWITIRNNSMNDPKIIKKNEQTRQKYYSDSSSLLKSFESNFVMKKMHSSHVLKIKRVITLFTIRHLYIVVALFWVAGFCC